MTDVNTKPQGPADPESTPPRSTYTSPALEAFGSIWEVTTASIGPYTEIGEPKSHKITP